MSKIYFVNISVTPLKEGMDMVLFVSKLAGLVQNYSNHTKILHKFKVGFVLVQHVSVVYYKFLTLFLGLALTKLTSVSGKVQTDL